MSQLQDFFSEPLDPKLIKKEKSFNIYRELSIDINTPNVKDKENAFRFGHKNFDLPLQSFQELAVGQSTILGKTQEKYEALKQSSAMIKLFLEHARQYPLVADFRVKKTRFAYKSNFFLNKEYRNYIVWRFKNDDKVASWDELYKFMIEMNLSHDEILCHARVNIIMLNINEYIFSLTREIRGNIDLMNSLQEMAPVLGNAIPDWLNIK